ncbi:toll/interleukin-1 receptor domain-containing protein [Serratia plymuthica]|uniref:toll/interleukin-1 receptor domain-containing protein n=1 Tax=Serratia plymuthica TaxID=82996 RepID=UPI0007EBF871|nr:toll/interleukin-1 receptor domain-containing protein [Serratia plymuthica]ANJ96881.1 hypothetical protein ADP73_02590 [Serratia plymuthica]
MARVFMSYTHKDEALRDELEVHLAMLKREGVIEVWHDRRINAGDDLNASIDAQLDHADIVLLLVSPDFLASKYCYDIEVQRAIARHHAGEARVIPVILRYCDWQSPAVPFNQLLAVPRDGLPVTKWPDRDEAFLDIVRQIRSALPKAPRQAFSQPSGSAITENIQRVDVPRSSNLRLTKTFTDVDKDRFLDEAFAFISRFFELSLSELQQRNSGIDSRFIPIDGNAFGCVIYQQGKTVARCGIRRNVARGFGAGISFSHDESAPGNTLNENLTVETDEQSMFLRPMGMQMFRGDTRDSKLSFEGAAEHYWALLIEPLQRR